MKPAGLVLHPKASGKMRVMGRYERNVCMGIYMGNGLVAFHGFVGDIIPKFPFIDGVSFE